MGIWKRRRLLKLRNSITEIECTLKTCKDLKDWINRQNLSLEHSNLLKNLETFEHQQKYRQKQYRAALAVETTG